ncbi:hypothetical protein DH2020_012472 [Rehmannia glutinosa]|uniref:Uncharacterized protein n=1 Tax=Rehmannia glutinosa TaxID=99300 RepID=A0ABR0WZG0_REHGL
MQPLYKLGTDTQLVEFWGWEDQAIVKKCYQVMEGSNHGGPPVSHGAAEYARPSLGFPLGTTLLLLVILVIFTLSGVISCCYHWDNLRRSFSLHAANDDGGDLVGPSNPKNSHMGEIIVEVQKPPPKPPRIAVPLY